MLKALLQWVSCTSRSPGRGGRVTFNTSWEDRNAVHPSSRHTLTRAMVTHMHAEAGQLGNTLFCGAANRVYYPIAYTEFMLRNTLDTYALFHRD